MLISTVMNEQIAKIKGLDTYSQDWAYNLDDAEALFREMPFFLIQRLNIPNFNGFVCFNPDKSVFEHNITMAQAICAAWIKWKETTK